MAHEIPAEAVAKFRKIEQRAEAANALSQSLRERLDAYRDSERDLKVSLHDYFSKAETSGRVEVTEGGDIELHTNNRTVILATVSPIAARLFKTRQAIDRVKRERDDAALAAAPILALAGACREALTKRGWDQL